MSLPRRFFSGSSLQQAVMQAARHYGAEPERLAWREVEKRHGFVKSPRSVVIEVDPAAPLRGAPAPAEPAPPRGSAAPVPSAAPREPAEPPPPPRGDPSLAVETPPAAVAAPAAAGPGRLAAAREAAETLLALADLRLEPRASALDEALLVELDGADRERVTADNGRVLFAIQHLLPRLVWGLAGETLPVRVDCANFHAAHEEELRELARRVAGKVRERGRPWHLEPMAPHERRIVHLALADDPEVETESVGEGYLKRVRIRPAQREERR